MTNLKNRSIAASAALVATILSMTVAVAPLRAEPVKVAYGDLDISSPAGASELQNRIRRAAKVACGQDGTPLQVVVCRQQAVKSAATQLAAKADRSDVQLASR
jgi:UrcA family protein